MTIVALSKMSSSVLHDFLHEKGLIGFSSSVQPDSFDLQSLENALEEWRLDDCQSITSVKKEVRSLGINLATGKTYGSAHKLQMAIKNGAATLPTKKAKRYPLLKSCLVTT